LHFSSGFISCFSLVLHTVLSESYTAVWPMLRHLCYVGICHSDASSLLVDILLAVEEADREDCINRLLDAIQKQQCKHICNILVY